MKVAFLSFYQQAMERGVENWLRELSQRFSQKLEVKVFSPPETRVVTLDYSSSFWRKLFLDSNSLAIFKFTQNIFSQLKNYDVLVPLNGGWQTFLSKIAAKIYKKKLVLVGQTGLGYDERWNLLWRPDLFVALTQSQAQWVRQYYSGPIKIIANAVDLNKFKPQGKKLNLKLKPPIILCAAALEKKEFFANLIRAVEQTNASLIMAGSGNPEKEKEVEDLAKKYLGKRFLIKKFSYQQMPLLYRSVDLFVYPNPAWESFGIVFLEAMATNLSVIANDDPIRREIIGPAGLFVKPENYQSIAAAIKKALKTDWGGKPRNQAKKFSWDKIVFKYEKLFKKLAKEN